MVVTYTVEQKKRPRHKVWSVTGALILIVSFLLAVDMIRSLSGISSVFAYSSVWWPQAVLGFLGALCGASMLRIRAPAWKHPWTIHWTDEGIRVTRDDGLTESVRWHDVCAVEEDPAEHRADAGLLIPLREHVTGPDTRTLELRVNVGDDTLHVFYCQLDDGRMITVPVPSTYIRAVRQIILQHAPILRSEPRAVISKRWKAYIYAATILGVLGIIFNLIAVMLLLLVLIFLAHSLFSVIRYGQTFVAGSIIRGRAACIVGCLDLVLSAVVLGVIQTLLMRLLA